MKRAAIGVRVHSGWGALVAISSTHGAVEVLERQRIAITPSGVPGANQPYHFAEHLELPAAEKFLGDSLATSRSLALSAVRNVIVELSSRHYRVVGAGILLASGHPMPPLARILSSHALIHAAEGEFFRDAFLKACETIEVPVSGLRERGLDQQVQTTFGDAASPLCQQVAALGHSLGPPWTRDQKTATLAALLVLADHRSGAGHRFPFNGCHGFPLN